MKITFTYRLARGLMSLLFVAGFAFAAQAQERTVSGTVTSEESGEALPGVNVVVKGTTAGTVTNIDGNYQLQVPEDQGILQFSFIGFLTKEVEVGSQSTLNVNLAPDIKSLQEVVVVGYGTQSRQKLTSSISSVSAEEIENIPVPTFEGALQGRMAGVNINQSSGTLGAPVTVRVRGTTSINASNQPLFVIDGIPLAVDNDADGNILRGSNFGTGGGTNQLANINPNDIESVEVLKDAAATALFGARGANGVVLITTKSGKSGKTNVNVGYYAGISEPTRNFDLVNGPEYQRLINYAGFGANGYGYFDPVSGSAFQNTEDAPTADHIDLVTRTAFLHQANASVSGGTDKTQFYGGITFRDEEGWIRQTSLQRISARLNLTQQVSEKFEIGLRISPTRTVNMRQAEDNAIASPYTNGALSRPDLPAFNEDGSVFLGNLFGGSPLGNLINQRRELVTYQTLGNLNLRYELLPGLSFRSEAGVDLTSIREEDRTLQDHTDAGALNGQGFVSSAQAINLNWNNLVDYNLTFGKSDFTILGGVTYQYFDAKTVYAEANTFGSPLLPNLNSASEKTDADATGTQFAFLGYLARVNYTFDNRYIIQASGRYDGSSRFGANNQYGFFPAISAGWLISEESFLENVEQISFLKLRSSYGLTGNAEIGNFASRGLAGYGNNYNNLPGFEQSNLANPNLTWEETAQFDIALDFGLLSDRISGTVGYFNKATEGLLLEVPLPLEAGIATTPVSVFQDNVGEINNQGFEFEIRADIVSTDDFTWNSSFNISTLKNEVRALPDNDGNGEADDIIVGEYIHRVGEPLASFYVVRYAGVDPANGNALFLNAEGEQTTDYSSSFAVVAGDPYPDYFGGFTNTIRWKGLDATVFFQYSLGQDIYRSEGEFVTTNAFANFGQARSQLNTWTPNNTNTNIPQARRFVRNGTQPSSRYLEDASYLRLKNASIGYTFPTGWVNGANIRLYTQAQNLLTFTNFEGVDPEVSRNDQNSPFQGETFFSRPQSRVITVGIDVTF